MKKKILFWSILGIIILSVTVFCVLIYFSIYQRAQQNEEFQRLEDFTFIIQGEKYIATPIAYTQGDQAIVKAGKLEVLEIPEDPEHNFLLIKDDLDIRPVVKESYIIPVSGKPTVAYCGRERITDGIKYRMIQSILEEEFQGSFTIQTDSRPGALNGIKHTYIGYENCPVGTDWLGAIGNINGQLVFIYRNDLNEEDLQYTCYVLQDEYQELYESSVHLTFETIS